MDKPLLPMLPTVAPQPRAPHGPAGASRSDRFRDHLEREVTRSRDDSTARELRETTERVPARSAEQKSDTTSGESGQESPGKEERSGKSTRVDSKGDRPVEATSEEPGDEVDFTPLSPEQIVVAEEPAVTEAASTAKLEGDEELAHSSGLSRAENADSDELLDSARPASRATGDATPLDAAAALNPAPEKLAGDEAAESGAAVNGTRQQDLQPTSLEPTAPSTASPTTRETVGTGGQQSGGQSGHRQEVKPPEAGDLLGANSEANADGDSSLLVADAMVLEEGATEPEVQETAPKTERPPAIDSKPPPGVTPARHQVAALGARHVEAERGPAPTVDASRFVSRVAKAFEAAEQRGGAVTLRLSPPELGAMRIELSVQQGVLSAHLETETAAAKSVLLDNLPALRERLAAQDIRIERFDIDVRQESGQGQSDWQAQQEARQQQRDGVFSGSTRSGTHSAADAPVTAEPKAPLLQADGRFNAVA